MLDSFFLGASLKIVDEVLDKDIEIQPLYLEIFKCLTIMLLVLTTSNDFPFALTTLLSLGFSYVAGGIDDDYWKAFIIITAGLCIFSFTPIESLWILPTLFIMPVFLYAEALIFPESTSVRKMIGSALMIPIVLIILQTPLIKFLKEKVPETGTIDKSCYFGIGYLLVRALVKAYVLYKGPTEDLPLAPLVTEPKNLEKEEV
jgi:hypothetical protein